MTRLDILKWLQYILIVLQFQALLHFLEVTLNWTPGELTAVRSFCLLCASCCQTSLYCASLAICVWIQTEQENPLNKEWNRNKKFSTNPVTQTKSANAQFSSVKWYFSRNISTLYPIYILAGLFFFNWEIHPEYLGIRMGWKGVWKGCYELIFDNLLTANGCI